VKLRVGIVDDEQPCEGPLRRLLAAMPEVEPIGEACDVASAVELIDRRTRPLASPEQPPEAVLAGCSSSDDPHTQLHSVILASVPRPCGEAASSSVPRPRVAVAILA